MISLPNELSKPCSSCKFLAMDVFSPSLGDFSGVKFHMRQTFVGGYMEYFLDKLGAEP
jgi:hypothetical protein